jgi:DNA mismatch endonuclease (patch repair protein)
MVDNLRPNDRRKTMQAVKGSNTSLERSMFSMLAGMGIQGWKKNVKDVKGKPDVVFFEQRVAVFVDGCFWHGCPICTGKKPEANSEYWQTKVLKNIARDEQNCLELVKEKWRVVRIWEHEMSNVVYRNEVRRRLREALKGTDKNGP